MHVVQERQAGDYIGTEAPVEAKYRLGNDFDQRGYSIDVWQRYASPVWFDIDQSRVLNFKLGKGTQDEKHICPLQLDVIERCIDLWSNKQDTIFTPFMGVGSEVVSAIKMGRKAVGIELKESYFKTALKFIHEAELEANRPTLFDMLAAES